MPRLAVPRFRLIRALAFASLLPFCSWHLAAQEPAPDEPDGLALERQVARTLVELDHRMELGTFPDGSGLWTSRMAAALEARGDGSLLRLRLAHRLRSLGVERDLVGVTGSEPPGEERRARLNAVLTAAEPVLDKLDRAASVGELDASPAAMPANDACSSASVLSAGTVSGSTVGAASDGSASCADSDDTPSVWYRFTPGESGSYVFDTAGSGFDTVLSLHSGCPGDPLTEELACSDDNLGISLAARIDRELVAGEEVWIRLSGHDGASGAFDLTAKQSPGLAGTVTREGTGAPLEGARVLVYAGFPGYVAELAATVETDAAGRWSASGLPPFVEPPNTYYLRFEEERSIAEVYDDVSCPFEDSCYPPATGTLVPLPDAGISDGWDAALAPGARLSGTVTDSSDGAPLSAFVSLYRQGTFGSVFLTSVETEADGSFVIGGLPADDYRLVARADGYGGEVYQGRPCNPLCETVLGTPIVVTTDSDRTGLDFALDRFGRIAGTVTEAGTGEPLAFEWVTVRSENGGVFERAYTGEDGRYETPGLPVGEYFVYTSLYSEFQNEVYDGVPCTPSCNYGQGTPVDVVSDQTTPGIDFALRRLGEIGGTLSEAGSGAPVAYASVALYDDQSYFVAHQYTDDLGQYRFEGLRPGIYGVLANDESYGHQLWDGIPCSYPCDTSIGTPIQLALDQVVGGIDFELVRRGTIGGTVTLKQPLQGVYSNLQVSFFDGDGDYVARADVEPDGSYRSPPLASGDYTVATSVDSHRDEVFPNLPCSRNICPVTSGQPISVTDATDLSGIDFVLDRLGVVEVSAVGADTGQLLYGWVDLYDPVLGRVKNTYVEYNSRVALLWGLEPGAYTVRFRNDDYYSPGYQSEVWGGVPCEPDCDVSTGTLLSLQLNGAVVPVRVELEPCPWDSVEMVLGTTFGSASDVEACDLLTAGGDTVVRSGADVVFRTGRAAVFGDGFVVESGASFRVEIEPSWAQPD